MKRLTGMLCAAAVAFSGIAPAFPAEMTVFAAEEAPTSGKCGENCTWKYDAESKTLTVEGKGNIDNYSLYDPIAVIIGEKVPWKAYRKTIENVVIKDGITGIGDGTFDYCTALTSVSIPKSVVYIGARFGFKSPWLTEMQQENPLVMINNILIDGHACAGDAVIPDNVTVVSPYAFYNCGNLTGVTFPKSVAKIGNYAFYGTPWIESKQKENPLVIINGILIDGSVCEGDVTVPEDVKCIAQDAFVYCKGLKTITLPEKLSIIEASAFQQCWNLTEITIPSGITVIGNETFGGCSALKSIIIPDTVTEIGKGAFRASGLESIVIPESVTKIGEEAFSFCHSLWSVTIENPACEIFDDSGTFSNEMVFDELDDASSLVFNGVIHGYAGSTAEKYAEQYDRKFEAIETASATPTGDLDGDGEITAGDAQNLLAAYAEILAGVQSSLTDAQKKACDIDKDGDITAADAQYILIYYTENTVAGNPVSWDDIVK